MIPALPFAISPRLAAYGVALAAFVAMATFAGCEHRAAAGARSERDALAGSVRLYQQANGDNVKAIASLRGAVEKWRALAAPSRPELGDLAAQIRFDLEKTRALIVRTAKETDHGNPGCVALLATDFERACPATASELRSQASDRPDPHRGGSSPGGGRAQSGSAPGLRAALPIPGQQP